LLFVGQCKVLRGGALKTIAYVDGFNLYYGCLKGTPYKWLDLCELFRMVLPAGYELVKVKYFTARISSLPNDPDAPKRQDVYLRALRAHCKGAIEIYEGRFSLKRVWMPRVDFPAQFVHVIKSEEKGSDVNLAVELVHGAWEDQYEAAAVASNDADLGRALKIAKQYRKKKVLLYTPGAPTRKPVADLTKWAHKHLAFTEANLADAQLPSPIKAWPTDLVKPHGW
jgi:hypothetical protein